MRGKELASADAPCAGIAREASARGVSLTAVRREAANRLSAPGVQNLAYESVFLRILKGKPAVVSRRFSLVPYLLMGVALVVFPVVILHFVRTFAVVAFVLVFIRSVAVALNFILGLDLFLVQSSSPAHLG
jgi:hypothetical protein